jgi:hypothetical protein
MRSAVDPPEDFPDLVGPLSATSSRRASEPAPRGATRVENGSGRSAVPIVGDHEHRTGGPRAARDNRLYALPLLHGLLRARAFLARSLASVEARLPIAGQKQFPIIGCCGFLGVMCARPPRALSIPPAKLDCAPPSLLVLRPAHTRERGCAVCRLP